MKILSKVTVAVAALALVLGTASAASALTYTGTLKVGSRGAAVSSLQTCLNGKGMSAGVADGIFGMGTKAAVMRFQSANSLAVDGIAGMATHAALGNCSTTVVPNDDNDDNGDVDLNDFIIQGGSEASLENLDINDGQDSDVTEGEEGVEIAEFKTEWNDSAVLAERMDVAFIRQDGSNGSYDPEDVFDSITLFLNGDEVDTISTSRSSAWDEDNYGDEDTDFGYTNTDAVRSLRFSGINEIIEEGEEAVWTIEADIANSVDNAPESWDIYLPANGLRYVDTAGISGFAGSDTQNATVTVDVEGADNALTLSLGEDNPDATTVEVDDSSRSSKTVVLEFDLESDEDTTEDIQINEIIANIDMGTDTYNDTVYEAVIKGSGVDEKGDVTANGTVAGGTAEVTFEFDDEDFVIESGDTNTYELILTFNSLTGNYLDGETITASIDSSDIDAEGLESGEEVTDFDGSANGEIQTLYTEGLNAELGDVSFTETENQDGAVTKVTYTIPVEITAFGNTFYVPFGAIRDTANATSGINFQIENGAGTVKIDSDNIVTDVVAVSSSANTITGAWRINDGDTETVTFSLSILGGDLGAAGAASFVADYYQGQLLQVRYDDDSLLGSISNLTLTPSQDFETDPRSIDA